MTPGLLARIFRRGFGLVALCLALVAPAAEIAVAPILDLSGLPSFGETWLKGNPYRGNPRALAIGQSAFNQSCARCHGFNASPAGGVPAPDLRQLNGYCRRIADAGLQDACMADNDQYFKKSVLQGKVIVGVLHMPSWKDVLSQDVVWAIQAFIESRLDEAGR